MRLQFSQFLAIASFIGWFINYMKLKKAWAKWLLGLVFLGSIVYIIFSNTLDKTDPTQSAITSGNNSPVIQAASGANVNANNVSVPPNSNTNNLTVIQAQTINIVQISKNDLKNYADSSYNSLIQKFPSGFILLGLEKGKLVYEPRLKTLEVNADWDSAMLVTIPARNEAQITIPKFNIISEGNGSHFELHTGEKAIFFVPLIENIVFRTGIPQMYIAVLDLSKGVFLIGFNPNLKVNVNKFSLNP